MAFSVQLLLNSALTTLSHLTIGVVLIGVLYCLLTAVFNPLRRIPGPFLARFTRLWYLRHVNKGQQHVDEVALHKKYGPIVRLAPNQYSFSDALAAKTIYDHGTKFPKSDFYTPFGSTDLTTANVFQELNIDAHAVKRRKVASLYSMTSIASYEPFVEDCMHTYINKLDKFASESQTIRPSEWMQFFAFDVIGAISTGGPYGFLDEGHDFPGIIHGLHKSQFFATHLGVFAGSWYPQVGALMSRMGKSPPAIKNLQYTQEAMDKKFKDLDEGKSYQETTGKQDFAEKLLALKARGKINDNDLMGSIRANIAAGSDTTGISMSAILYYLLRTPSVLTKLREEIRSHKAKQEDPTAFMTFTEAQQMPYLQAVIKEALRLHPAVGMQLPRLVPEGGATIAGRFFPAGTIVGVNSWVIHRQPEIFGEDASQFRPERWLEDEERAKFMDRNIYTFGAGSRTCIGKNISLLEIQKLVPELLNRYDFDLAGSKEWQSKNRFFVYEDYECSVRRRNTKEG